MKTWGGKPLPEHLRTQVAALEAMPDESIDYSDAPSPDDWSGAVRGRFASKSAVYVGRRIKLPEPMVRIFAAAKELEELYKGKYERKFTVDGHLLGSVGEVVAAEEFGLKLYKMGHAGHDASDSNGDVQIKITAGKSIEMYDTSNRLLVLQIVSNEEVEVVYDGSGDAAWQSVSRNKLGKGGQRRISINKLRALAKIAP